MDLNSSMPSAQCLKNRFSIMLFNFEEFYSGQVSPVVVSVIIAEGVDPKAG